jgi:hypothetical protein
VSKKKRGFAAKVGSPIIVHFGSFYTSLFLLADEGRGIFLPFEEMGEKERPIYVFTMMCFNRIFNI